VLVVDPVKTRRTMLLIALALGIAGLCNLLAGVARLALIRAAADPGIDLIGLGERLQPIRRGTIYASAAAAVIMALGLWLLARNLRRPRVVALALLASLATAPALGAIALASTPEVNLAVALVIAAQASAALVWLGLAFLLRDGLARGWFAPTLALLALDLAFAFLLRRSLGADLAAGNVRFATRIFAMGFAPLAVAALTIRARGRLTAG
jgi:hypothetical protein